ncbi:MAG: N-acetylneuraminate synthase [Devosia sp.]|uniref:N-acetylneuraminate synthase family protein n=1 Tax=Devosia sp. TaxID=1871048 RepID=UPI00261E1F29|nr:N-acetylneuraminate synthase family protein [Devosia sp.]MDB5526934.1 N-acetylneuraminate synthase [Devosia sp.]
MNFRIGERLIGPDQPPFVVLEAGINHNGELDKAREMIRVAKAAGADAIKFQTFKADEFVGDPNQMFTYRSQGKEVAESMLEMFRRYEFSRDEWFAVKATCDAEGMLFLSTPQNVSDLELLLEIGVPMVKVGSDDFTNLPLLRRYAMAKLPMMISCGMADMGEVYDALEATGALHGNPVLLMLCTSQYPTPPKDVNLTKLTTLAGAFPGLPLGFSDHSQGYWAASVAVGLGAVAFEKHFTLDRDLPGPDHWFSEDPRSAAAWVDAIRTAKTMLGSPFLAPTAEERAMRVLARRSVTALRDIAEGEPLSADNVGLRRPGNGLAPKFIDLALGHKSRHALKKGEQLTLGSID